MLFRSATELAAIRRGWVWPIRPAPPAPRPRPSASAILGSWVVLPEPVSPATITTWWSRIAAAMSSRRWLTRQLNDPYVARARSSGYRSRAAFKLAEIDDAHRLLKPGMVVADLGAAPGGWSQVAAERTRSREGKGRVVAIDLQAIDPIPGVEILQGDFLDDQVFARVAAETEIGRAHV